MTYRYLTDLAEAARKSGLKVVELDGWKRRGRPYSTGGFDPEGILVHHTGGESDSIDYVRWMTLDGRDDLPAPLCQIALSRKGIVYICAAGRANHGGTAKASGPMPAGDANELYIGIEAMNTGSEGWTKEQYEAYVKLCAALCEHYGWDASHVRAHKETSVTGKWDPGNLDMNEFRRAIATGEKEDDVSAADVWNYKDPKTGESMRLILRRGRDRAAQAADGVAELAKLLKAMPGCTEDMAKIADDIVARTAAEVERLDAEAVAEQLEINVKEA